MPTNMRALGPVEHYFRPYGTTQFSYLGTAVSSPRMQTGESFLPIYNDLGGRSVEMGVVRDRKKSRLVTTLNRFNWTNLNVLKGYRPVGQANATSLVEAATDHGVPVMGYSHFDFLFIFTFGTAFSGLDTPLGRLYFGSYLTDYAETSEGSRVVEVTLQIDSIGLFNPADRSFTKYTEDPAFWGNVQPE